MKSIHSTKWLALLALTTVALAAQDSITLRRELKAGTTDTYKIESDVKQLIDVPSMGEQDLILTQIATIALKTLSVNDARSLANVETLTKVEKSTMEGSIAAMIGGSDSKLPEPKTEKGTLDTRGRLVFGKDAAAKPGQAAGGVMAMGLPGIGAASAQSMLSLIELPEKAMKIGESVEVPMPNNQGLSSAGVKDLKMTVKLVGEKVVDGQTLLLFAFTGQAKLDMDSSKSPGAAESPMGNMKMSGTAQLSGEGLVDKATGKTVSHTMNIKNDAKVLLEQVGMEFPVKGTIVTKISLVKG